MIFYLFLIQKFIKIFIFALDKIKNSGKNYNRKQNKNF